MKCDEVDADIAELKSEIKRKEAVGQRWFERCMEERSEAIRLKRALWKERADNASRIGCMFRTLSDIEDDDTRMFWIFGNPERESVFYHLKCHRMKTAYDWTMIWQNVESKRRAKVEEYR